MALDKSGLCGVLRRIRWFEFAYCFPCLGLGLGWVQVWLHGKRGSHFLVATEFYMARHRGQELRVPVQPRKGLFPMMRSRAGNLNVRIRDRPAHLLTKTCVQKRMMSRYTALAVAVFLLFGCASAPPQDNGWRACWVGTWIA